jgi:hypothetical protein
MQPCPQFMQRELSTCLHSLICTILLLKIDSRQSIAILVTSHHQNNVFNISNLRLTPSTNPALGESQESLSKQPYLRHHH